MQKAVQLKVILWIEGEDQPAHDFAASSMQTVKEMISSAAASHPNISIKIKQIEEDDSDE